MSVSARERERESVLHVCGCSIYKIPKISLVCFGPKEDSTKQMTDNATAFILLYFKTFRGCL